MTGHLTAPDTTIGGIVTGRRGKLDTRSIGSTPDIHATTVTNTNIHCMRMIGAGIAIIGIPKTLIARMVVLAIARTIGLFGGRGASDFLETVEHRKHRCC